MSNLKESAIQESRLILSKYTDKTAYVLGFLFNSMDEVALIRKERPHWQRGKLNGIGGQVEPGETPLQAMCREFAEEAGNMFLEWQPMGQLRHKGTPIFLFRGYVEHLDIWSPTDEVVDWFPNQISMTGSVLRNLKWLIPLAKSTSEEIVLIEDLTEGA